MKSQENNLIIFPTWKSSLEKKSKEALEEKRYQDALDYLEKLSEYDVNSHEVLTGKLICLMELGEQEKAELLGEELLSLKNEHFYEYLHIYATLLFQASKYDEAIDLLEVEIGLETVPEPLQTQLQQVCDISKKLSDDRKEEQASVLLVKLKRAVQDQEPVTQWRLLEKLRSIYSTTESELLTKMLVDKTIQPVVKTAIILLYQAQNIDASIELEKFGQSITINPSELSEISNHKAVEYIMSGLEEVEQENPTLFELIKELMYRYVYVRYPIMPTQKECGYITEALKLLGYEYLQMQRNDSTMTQIDPEVTHYIEEIIASEKEYFSIIQD
ncbi:tetratricopeptide repeat protein [Aquibacillus koreensis]|uniref:Tetratricopeptide repeat protein n=1 Tax=Aquibacillus koreensis TaxID=279446 RepID=A0A9X3WKT0_9BACI|nr:DUF3196 family protein [Aquibacillus koreensis]MCT2537920.1 tetratricopeptide repeat protein [Aquibacillus koreensis]MDC3419189.1 tetratricopeptide repeat protein [Aquibacillus koreensis]